jgi:hypothetical protein
MLARLLKITRRQKLPVDSTVGEAHLHYLTESGLLAPSALAYASAAGYGAAPRL